MVVIQNDDDEVTEESAETHFDITDSITDSNLMNNNHFELSIETNNSYDINSCTSPTMASPKGSILPRSKRYNQLKDACQTFINAWINHPHFHDKALGYIINGTNCITNPNSNSLGNLQELADSFVTTFGSNTTGDLFNHGPKPASSNGPHSGRDPRKRLISSTERYSMKPRKCPKIGGSGNLPKCTFCNGVGHNRTSCNIRKGLGREYNKTVSNLFHMLKPPIKYVPLSFFKKESPPSHIPEIPDETCRIQLNSIFVPEEDKLTLMEDKIFVNIKQFDSTLNICDERMGSIYKLETLKSWILTHITDKKSNKFSIHENFTVYDEELDVEQPQLPKYLGFGSPVDQKNINMGGFSDEDRDPLDIFGTEHDV